MPDTHVAALPDLPSSDRQPTERTQREVSGDARFPLGAILWTLLDTDGVWALPDALTIGSGSGLPYWLSI